jgi:hypothetical protein
VPVILATQEKAEIRKITVGSQPGQITILKIPITKKKKKRGGGGWSG